MKPWELYLMLFAALALIFGPGLINVIAGS
jgi:hypothetical protein